MWTIASDSAIPDLKLLSLAKRRERLSTSAVEINWNHFSFIRGHQHPSTFIRPVWSESSLCAEWVAKDSSLLHADSVDSDQTGRMPRLMWLFAGRTVTLLVLSCRGPYRSLWLFPLDPCYTTIFRIPLVPLDPAVVAIIHLGDRLKSFENFDYCSCFTW